MILSIGRENYQRSIIPILSDTSRFSGGVLHTVSGVGLVTTVLTIGRFATFPGAGSFFKTAGIARDTSLVEVLATEAIGEGTVSAAAAGTVRVAAGVASNVALPITLGALAVEGTFAGARLF